MTMLSIVLGISIASLVSGQPMSLNEPLSCSFFTCSDAILGAVEACESVIGSSEELIDCVKNILESNGQGDCKACICHIIPMFCHDKETVSTETKSQKNLAQRTELVKHAKSDDQCGPDQTPCPSVGSSGCCPEANWFCCVDGHYCAATAADCPSEAKKTLLVKHAKSNQCGPDETTCPAGCCPMGPNWYCCPYFYCAATAADCPFEAKKTLLVKLAKSN
jgi:hypothetical protein